MLDELEPLAFTTFDRCDRCMVGQAYMQADKNNFHPLLFCLHHASEFGSALLEDGWTLRADETRAEELFVGENKAPVVW